MEAFCPFSQILNRNSVQVSKHRRNSDHLILSRFPSGDGFNKMLVCPLCVFFNLISLPFISGVYRLSLAQSSFQTKYFTVGGPEWGSCLNLKPIPLQIQSMCPAWSLAGALTFALWGSGDVSCRRPHTHWVNSDYGGRFWLPPTAHTSVAFPRAKRL